MNKWEEGKLLAIDFDGTIVEHSYPNIGKLREGAKFYINKLFDEGFYIIIFTCRSSEEGSLQEMEEFLNKNEIKYHKINKNAPKDILGFECLSPKIVANWYIDDKGLIPLPSWAKIYKIVTDIGVYEIVNIKTNKRYIGSSLYLRKRIDTHLRLLKANSHKNKYLQNAWNKEGEDCFEIKLIHTSDKYKLREQEYNLINSYDLNKDLYNLSKNVEAFFTGCKHTEESKLKMSASRKGKESKRKGKVLKDWYNEEEIIEKRKLFSDIHKGKKNGMFGKTHSKESKLKISLKNKGKTHKPLSEEQKINRSKIHRGIHNNKGKNNPRYDNTLNDREIINLYKKGYTGNKISRIIGCNHNKVYRRLKFLGVKNEQ